MDNKEKKILLYSLNHFIVDFVCAIFMIGQATNIAITSSQYIIAIISYNFFAFAFQVPLGMLMDKFRIYKYVSVLGVLLILLAYLQPLNNVVYVAVILGIGNALFHLEGGTNIYKISNKKAGINGVFVAPGAMGIFLGTYFATKINYYILFILMIFSIITLIYIQKSIENTETHEKNTNRNIIGIVTLIGISIIVRSIGGTIIQYDWKNTFILSILYAFCIVIGKSVGGFLGDKIDFKKVTIISLFLSTIFGILGYRIKVLAYIGILLFNIPMAITLTILANSLKNKTAMAIGLNTMFLFIGFLFNFINLSVNRNLMFIVSNIIAIISIYIAITIYNKNIERNERNEEKN